MPETESSDDSDLSFLLRRAQDGDENALDEFLVRTQRPVMFYVRRRIAEPRLERFVEDVVAEVLARVFRHYTTCTAVNEREVMGWVLTIAHNEALRLLERRSLTYGLLLGDTEPADLYVSARTGERPRPGVVYSMVPGSYQESTVAAPSPAMAVLLKVVEELQDGLGDDLNRLLYLRLIEDRSWNEVAEDLGTTTAGAKRRFQRAQAKLLASTLAKVQALPERERELALGFLELLGS